ncbi:hypothetical protein C2S51_023120 [Perilla frutescens var. frutescens]|nr:hypothetical protein C2S51_023120 [Perilla frutescens var. frutescens]
MKSIEVFCASPASTAICSSTDHRAIIRHGIRSIDRHVHRLGETPRARDRTRTRTNAAPCSSHVPINPSRKTTTTAAAAANKKHPDILRRKSSADVHDLAAGRHGSSRYLLTDQPFFDFVSSDSQPEKRLNLDAFPALRSLSTRSYDSPVFTSSSSSTDVDSPGKLIDHLNAQKSSFTPSTRHQVVELRVSIHCKGCEGKLRKHISRMEGVTSFSIDLETKKVTVIGNVTPLGVLTSISKVKNAQFWPSPASPKSVSQEYRS